MVFALSTGDKQSFVEIYNRYNTYPYTKKSLIVNTFKYLWDFISDQKNYISLDELINGLELKKRNKFMIMLLRGIKYLENNQYQEAIDQLDQIPRLFYFPIYAFIIFKAKFKAQKALGLDCADTLYKLQEFAANDFLKIACERLQ